MSEKLGELINSSSFFVAAIPVFTRALEQLALKPKKSPDIMFDTVTNT